MHSWDLLFWNDANSLFASCHTRFQVINLQYKENWIFTLELGYERHNSFGYLFSLNFLENNLFLVPSDNSVGTKRKGKVQWNANVHFRVRKVTRKDNLVPECIKEDLVWSSNMDSLSSPPILRFWERSGVSPRRAYLDWEEPSV